MRAVGIPAKNVKATMPSQIRTRRRRLGFFGSVVTLRMGLTDEAEPRRKYGKTNSRHISPHNRHAVGSSALFALFVAGMSLFMPLVHVSEMNARTT
jgi:hypothetical protein